jgi:hypothetical protein
MKHIVLTVLVCLDVAAFAALYLRGTELVAHAIVEGLSEIPVSTECSVPRDFIRTFLDTVVHQFTVTRAEPQRTY